MTKKLFLVLAALTIAFDGVSQGKEWTMVDGKARLQSVIEVPGKNANELNHQVHLWLAATFKDSQSVIKARVDPEYVKGVGYHAGFYKLGALSSADFQYAFSIDIKDGKVRLTLSSGIVLYDNPHEINPGRPIERYFDAVSKRKGDKHAQQILAAVNTMSASLVASLEKHLATAAVLTDDW